MSAHTQGEARVASEELDDGDCVVMVGERQILECFEDGEVQSAEDKANARRVVKVWNAHQRLVEHLRGALGLADLLHHSGELSSDPRLQHRYMDAAALLRELEETQATKPTADEMSLQDAFAPSGSAAVAPPWPTRPSAQHERPDRTRP